MPRGGCAIVGGGLVGFTAYVALRRAGLEPAEIAVFGSDPDPAATWRRRAAAIRQRAMRSESDGHCGTTSFPGLAVREAVHRRSPVPLLRSVCDRYHPTVEEFLGYVAGLRERLSWDEAFRPALVGAVLVVFAGVGGVAWATRPPTVTLAAGIHRGPLVLDREQSLVGEPGAIVVGGIRITADGVVVRGVTVVGGRYGIEVDRATRVRLEDIRVFGSRVVGIDVHGSQVTIDGCLVQRPAGRDARGVNVALSADLPPTVVEHCVVNGGGEGLVAHHARVRFHDNVVTSTRLRAITVTDDTVGVVEGNEVRDALGVGIYCGVHSECEIERNAVTNTRDDAASGDRTRRGYGIVADFGATVTASDNVFAGNAAGGVVAFPPAYVEGEESR